MSRTCPSCLGLVALLVSLAAVHGQEAKTPRTDLYGDPLPSGAVMRLGTIRLRHYEADMVFSKDGKQLISCGCDGAVRFWDAASGRLLRRKPLRADKQGIARAVLSPGGTSAAFWNASVVHVYDTATGAERGRVRISNHVNFGLEPLMRFSPDGKLLVLQMEHLPTHVCDLGDFTKRRTLRGQHTYLDEIAFTPDGKRLLGRDGSKLFLWDVGSGAEIDTGGQATVPRACGLAFTPDGKTVAVGSDEDDGATRLLDATTLKEKARLKGTPAIKAICEDRLIFSPDGRFLAGASATGRRRRLFLDDMTGANKPQRLPGWNVFAFSPNDKTLLYSMHEFASQFRLWDVAARRPVFDRPGHDRPVEALAVSPDGKQVISDANDALYLWDVPSGRLLRRWDGRYTEDHACLFSPDGKRLIRVDWHDTLQVLDAASGKELRHLGVGFAGGDSVQFRAVHISADGKRLMAVILVRESAGRLYVWDALTGKPLRQRAYPLESRIVRLSRGSRQPRGFAHAAFAPDGDVVSAWRNGRVGLEEVATGRLLALLPKGVGRPLRFSADGRLVAAAILQPKKDPADGDDRKGVSLIEAVSGEEVLRLEVGEFEQLAFTPDGRGLVVTDKKSLHVWDTETGERLHKMAWPASVRVERRMATMRCLAVSAHGRAITGTYEGDIVVWDLAAATWPKQPPKRPPDRKELEAWWSDLAADARKAHRAIARLSDAPLPSVAFLQEHFRPAPDGKRIEKLLADLDSDSFSTRERASRALERMLYRAEPRLRWALQNKPSLEVRRRIEAILREPRLPAAEDLRTLRAIAVLERIGTPEARRLLEKLARDAVSPETRGAQAALQRLKHRDAWTKRRSSP